MAPREKQIIHLRNGGVSVVFDLGAEVPEVAHWGHALEPLDDRELVRSSIAGVGHNSPDEPRRLSIWPSHRDGWVGTPALVGHADGRAAYSHVRLTHTDSRETGVTFTLQDDVAQLDIRINYELDAAGVLALSVNLERQLSCDVPFEIQSLDLGMPVPAHATELLDFTGGWLQERRPQRSPLTFGSRVRESRRGRPGHDGAFLTVVGTEGFRFRSGEVWATHLAWSGDQRHTVNRLPDGAGAFATAIGVGELLAPGEIRLGEGETYTSPTALFAWSGDGLDGLATRFHKYQRALRAEPLRPRPLLLNTWESVYFDQRLEPLLQLVEHAAEVGVERFVLDDGWFTGRTDATRALGDWTVDSDRWPDGLHPLVDEVRRAGMEFGLWVEPEMVSPESQLAVEHPEWILGPAHGPGPTARRQLVLNLADPAAFAHILDRLDRLVGEYHVDYLKWDHNRDLLQPLSRVTGRPVAHAQVLASYALMAELQLRHPSLEIEACAGGGGRVDLGIGNHVERFWISDCNDPVERIGIERWTGLVIAPERMGSHLGGPRAHTTGRVTDLSFRLATTLFGHAGIEWDLSTASTEDRAFIAEWSALYKRFRSLVATGAVVNADLPDGVMLRGVVSEDARQALYLWARLHSSLPTPSGRVRVPGLRADTRYRLRLLEPFGAARRATLADAPWLDEARGAGFECPGSLLTGAGLILPSLAVQNAVLIEVEALSE